ncbi:hypothetical protein Tco_0454781 [Tanacetum coccineum]
MVGGNGGNQFRQYIGQNVRNQNGYNALQNVGNQNPNGNGNVVAARAEGNAIGNNDVYVYLYIIRCKFARVTDLDEIEEVNANCILMANLQQASTSDTQTNKAPVYDSYGLAEVHNYDNCYDNAIFNMFTQEEQYTELLEPIPESHQVPQNDNNVIFEVSSVEQSGEIVKQHPANPEETRALYDSLYNNLATEVEKLSKEKSIVSSLLEEKKRLKFDFKIREDELLDKQIQLENKIKELDNILVKMGQSIQTMHVLLPKPDSFYHTKQIMALGYQNPFYLKYAQQKQQSLYDVKILLEKHDPPAVYDSEETLQLAQKKAAEFVRDFKSLAKEADESLAKHKALELEIERLLRAVNGLKIVSLKRRMNMLNFGMIGTKSVKNANMTKFRKYQAYNDKQQKIERLQAQLGDQKGKSKDTPCVSNTLDPLSQKLENENVVLEFQVRNYEKENAHLKTTYKNLFESISVICAQTKTIIDSLQNKLHDTMYENAKLRAQLFDKVSEQEGATKGMSVNTQFCKQSILGKPPSSSKSQPYVVTPFPKSKGFPKINKMNALSKPVTSNSTPSTRELKGVQTVNVIAPRIFRTNPSKTSRVDNVVPNKSTKTSVRIKPITISQPNVIHKQQANSDSNGFSSTRVNNTAKTRRPHPRSNSNTDRVPSKSKSSCLSNNVKKIEENHRNSQIPKNQKHMSYECNNITLAIRNAKSEIVYVMCKQCLVKANHDVCVLDYVNNMNSHADNRSANVYIRENQKKHKENAKKSKELGSKGSHASSRPSKPRTCLRLSRLSKQHTSTYPIGVL